MNLAFKILLVVCFFSVSVYAGEAVREFSFKTVEGKTIGYRAASGAPMVINIGSHW